MCGMWSTKTVLLGVKVEFVLVIIGYVLLNVPLQDVNWNCRGYLLN